MTRFGSRPGDGGGCGGPLRGWHEGRRARDIDSGRQKDTEKKKLQTSRGRRRLQSFQKAYLEAGAGRVALLLLLAVGAAGLATRALSARGLSLAAGHFDDDIG